MYVIRKATNIDLRDFNRIGNHFEAFFLCLNEYLGSTPKIASQLPQSASWTSYRSQYFPFTEQQPYRVFCALLLI